MSKACSCKGDDRIMSLDEIDEMEELEALEEMPVDREFEERLLWDKAALSMLKSFVRQAADPRNAYVGPSPSADAAEQADLLLAERRKRFPKEG